MKYFLLLAGSMYYPNKGNGDWIGCYETKYDARQCVSEKDGVIYIDGVDNDYDWYEIVDLREWIQ